MRLNSPRWGVNTRGLADGDRWAVAVMISGCKASASKTSGRVASDTTSESSCCVSGSCPMPGPTRRTEAFAKMRCRSTLPSRASPPEGVSGQGIHMASGAAAAKAAATDSGARAVTRPTPLRRAALTLMSRAPGIVREPPRTRRWPKARLSLSGGRKVRSGSSTWDCKRTLGVGGGFPCWKKPRST